MDTFDVDDNPGGSLSLFLPFTRARVTPGYLEESEGSFARQRGSLIPLEYLERVRPPNVESCPASRVKRKSVK